ncbi:uncharacterized protein GLRG_09420 [Colletotrichum graminicola M1.001]|uniref:LPXTG-domain-containing protein n=1 Tax=Colletotrichum graminicola (strain M1.001 / M2 / FGSC 10212) TaxID=645133 RepID=E3QTW4_COLGM|nr:uncharacterized protein GLRG_09420 [Colletotrichum graminicola M1.001]EFQ34276.1 hypothetical protein GLRG_09420 [Colletotrichum graminicola M1.001]
MRSESASAFGLLAGVLVATGPAAARPDVYARSQQIRRQNERECSEDLEDILDNAPTTSMPWRATACDYTSTLSGAELSATYASFRSRMSSWYTDDLDDITKLEASCTQYASIFSQIRYCYVTGPVPTATTATPTSSRVVTTTSTGAGGITTATVTTTATPDGDRGMDDGAKAGLAIGVVLAVLLLMFIGYKTLMKYRAKRLDAAAAPANKDAGPEMGAAGAMGAAAAAAAKPVPQLDSSSLSELDPAAAVAVPRTTGVHRHFAELDPHSETQLSELPADNYDPTLDAGSPPPAYVSPVTDSGARDTLCSVVSPVSPDSSTISSRHGLGISSTISEGDALPNANGDAGAVTNQTSTVQQGFGRGWLPKEG